MCSAPCGGDQVYDVLGVEWRADATVGGVSLATFFVLPVSQDAENIFESHSARTFMRSVIADDTKVGLLLFDEPSASLDPVAEHGKTVSVVVTAWCPLTLHLKQIYSTDFAC